MADFGGAELDAFRTEVRDWIAANYPAELKDPKAKTDPEAVWGGRAFEGSKDPQIVWMNRAAEKGWTAPTWPTEYGGGGLKPAQARVVEQELAKGRPPLLSFGLWMLGVLRVPLLSRERRIHLASRPTGAVGSLLVGITFGAGWTPCVGPLLASILLYSGMSATAGRGMLLLAAYSLGLGLPFWLCAVAFNWYLAGARRFTRWLRPVERVTGAILVIVGVLLITGHFATMSRTLAGFGQLFNLE